MQYHTQPGKSFPLGATPTEDGVNFSVFSKNATAVELLLFESAESPYPAQIIELHPVRNKTFYYWHVLLEDARPGLVYGYRVHGPHDISKGFRFDGHKVLVDPYAHAISTKRYDREAASRPGDNTAKSMRCIVANLDDYDWEDDEPLRHPYGKTVIYEMHVGGFTKHPSSGVSAEKRGTYLGLIEKIPYLKELGITAVELLPTQQFDPFDTPNRLTNYWGYSPVGFFAPHDRYASDTQDPLAPIREFRDMVKALHQANIEVIMDVVFNHSAEGGNHEGATLCFKGFENKAYYTLDAQKQYIDYSGCGNTLNANHSIVRRMIMDSLRFWVEKMHVDGFRFDLASVMSRDTDGAPTEEPPILWEIESDPILAGTKIIAEAWDAAGLYQVGSFIGHRWAEWNGKYRDDVRRFMKGDTKMVYPLHWRIEGSHDLFQEQETRDPNRSIQFVTCHDGFTMNDLVSYNGKHNEANLEQNRDGTNDNFSWNCGEEGDTTNPQIQQLRLQQIRNFFAITLLSQGTPMLLMGDEVRHTQHGNNNVYCQDNELTWFNWEKVDAEQPLLSFVRKMIQLNLNHEVFQEKKYWHLQNEDGIPRITWHGIEPYHPDWGEHSHSIAYMLTHPATDENIYVAINAYWDDLTFTLPEPLLEGNQYRWHLLVDTAQHETSCIWEETEAPALPEQRYEVKSRSVVVCKALPGMVIQ